MSKPRIAVVGGGLFGVTAAVELAKQNYAVTLYEREPRLLSCATGSNQNRLHLGYHYPRSRDTAIQLKASRDDFMEMYSAAVVGDVDHYYAIASQNSRTSAAEFLQFCATMQLPYEIASPWMLREDAVDLCVKVPEALVDPEMLRTVSLANLRQSGVAVHLGTAATARILSDYDFIILATYANLNELGEQLGIAAKQYLFQVCEKPAVRFPTTFGKHSVVIIDGPFMCFDPLGNTDLFLLGNVCHAIHARNIGVRARIPRPLVDVLNQGIITNPPQSNYGLFVHSLKTYFMGAEDAVYCGSLFTVRSVLPYVEDTDERPTVLAQHNGRVFSVWSGKLLTCVSIAKHLASRIHDSLSSKPPLWRSLCKRPE